MPEEPANQSIPPISQTLQLFLEASIEKAKPMLATLDKLKKKVAVNEKTLAKYQKLWEKTQKQLAKSRKVFDKVVASQKKIADKVKAATAKVMSQTKALRKQQQQMRQNVQASRSYTSSLARLAVVAGGAFLGLRKLQEFVDNRFTVALNNGAQALQSIADSAGAGISADRAFELVSRFQQQDLSSLALGMREEVQRGLLDAQAQLAKGVGIQKSNEILLNLTKAIQSPQKLDALLTGAGSLEERILGSATTRNLREVVQALNALQLPPTEDEGKQASLLKSAADVAASLESMNKAVSDITVNLATKLKPAIEKISALVSAHPTAAIGVGAAGAAAGTVGIQSVINALLLKRFLGKGAALAVAGKAAQTSIPVIQGFAQRKIIAETAKITTARLLGQFAGRALLAPAAAAAASAGIIAAPVAGGGGLIVHAQKQREEAIRQQFQGFQGLQEQLGAMSRKATEAQRNAPDELQQLRARRLGIDTRILASDPDSRSLGRLRFMRKQVVAQIESLRESASAIEETASAISESAKKTAEMAEPAEEAAKQLEKTKDALKGVGETAATALASLMERARQMQDLTLSATLEQSRTQLRQVERDLASVFHPLLGLNEQRSLSAQRQQEIESLENILSVMEIRDDKDRIEANKLRLQIRQLELSNRQDSQKLRDAFQGQLGQIIGNVGRFSKIIVSLQQQKNLAPAISKDIANLSKQIPFLTGQAGGPSKGLVPRSAAEVFGATPFPFSVIDSRSIISAKREIGQLQRQAPEISAPPRAAFEGQTPEEIEQQQSIERSRFHLIEDESMSIQSEAMRPIPTQSMEITQPQTSAQRINAKTKRRRIASAAKSGGGDVGKKMDRILVLRRKEDEILVSIADEVDFITTEEHSERDYPSLSGRAIG